MLFENPFMLWALPLVLIPLVIHWINVRKIKTVHLSDNRFIQSVLIQLHIATESSKFGFSDSELLQFLNNYNPAVFPHLKIKGIMAMASLTQNMEQIEREFQLAQQTFHQLKLRIPEAEILSMGMSSDFPLAIKHGSTLIRMGTALFGSRTQST